MYVKYKLFYQEQNFNIRFQSEYSEHCSFFSFSHKKIEVYMSFQLVIMV